MDDQLTVCDLLQVRLLCCLFQDTAWRAFGKAIGETVFDVGSGDSEHNLRTVASQSGVVPWSKRLALRCSGLYGYDKVLNLSS